MTIYRVKYEEFVDYEGIIYAEEYFFLTAEDAKNKFAAIKKEKTEAKGFFKDYEAEEGFFEDDEKAEVIVDTPTEYRVDWYCTRYCFKFEPIEIE